MSTREATAFQRLKGYITRPTDRFERVENGLGAGMPDVNYCFVGIEGWIELKAPEIPARESTQLMGEDGINVDQASWFMRQRAAGGRAYLLVVTKKALMLVDSKLASDRARVNAMTLSQLFKAAVWKTRVPIEDATVWIQLRGELTRP